MPRDRRLFTAAVIGILYGIHLCLLIWAFGSGRGNFHDLQFREGGSDAIALYSAGLKATRFQPLYEDAGSGSTLPSPPFRYLPSTAYTLGLPIAAMPLGSMRYGWLILCECLLLVNAWLCWRWARTPVAAIAGGALWLLFSPVFVDLWLGQFSLLAASLMFWAYLDFTQQPGDADNEHAQAKLRAELFWLGAVLVKVMPLLYVPALLRSGHRGTVERVVGFVLATTALYFAVWPQEFSRFLELNFPALPRLDGGNQGLSAAILVAAEGHPGIHRLTHLAVCVLVWTCTWFATSISRDRCLLRTTMLWTAAFLLTFGDVWEHHYLLLVPSVVGLVLRPDERRRPQSFIGVAVCMALLAIPNPVRYIAAAAEAGTWIPATESPRYWLALGFHFFRPGVTAALFAVLLSWALRAARDPAPHASPPDLAPAQV